MVFKFRLISNEQDEFVRDFEILDNQTFFDFHMAIQENLRFDRTQIASFIICNQDWEKIREITLFELMDEEEEQGEMLVMDSSRLKDQVSGVHDKLLYVFDVFNERILFIELVDTSIPNPAGRYPKCTYENGHPPQQILMDPIFPSDRGQGGEPESTEEFFGEEIMDDLDELGYHTLDETYPDEE